MRLRPFISATSAGCSVLGGGHTLAYSRAWLYPTHLTASRGDAPSLCHATCAQAPCQLDNLGPESSTSLRCHIPIFVFDSV
ncbi:hypothetical protein BV25DRAFT_951143 [Artomyces pyxidatus]|uniref:Uncharacterized protein n=1 Tax=Artomyces pyxidatus TaxID=48021 RepID=A0ACB8SVU0_9AGAM|nr:hypothetical protein BV25DRAFT_951143 [Artomyces pyxidatus]